MIFHFLLTHLSEQQLRMMVGGISAFWTVLIYGLPWIWFSRYFLRSKVRPYTPVHHQQKNNTPTMGGVLMLAAIIVHTCMWCILSNSYVKVFLFCITAFSMLGAWDDWCKIRYQRGISARTKFLGQIICAVGTVALWFYCTGHVAHIVIPFTQLTLWVGPYVFFAWAVFVLIATSNAVNITDGLDGLAAGCLVPNFIAFAFFSSYCADSNELAVVSMICAGVLLAFLCYNKNPARLFMGDVGSVGLGAALASIALMMRAEIILIVTGIVFVAETLSVILQVFWCRRYRIRLFKMAPLHHHFELSGWRETAIVACCTGISCIFSAILVGWVVAACR